MNDVFKYHGAFGPIAQNDVDFLVEKDRSYGASWKKSGGRSAWFMLLRKMDRLMEMMRRPDPPHGWSTMDYQEAIPISANPNQDTVVDASIAQFLLDSYLSEDIFLKIKDAPQGEDGSVLAEIRDLRRYLLLVEAEMVNQGVVAEPGRKASTGERRCEWSPGNPAE